MEPESFTAREGRLDREVAERLGLTRAEAQRLIAADGVLVDGQARIKSFALHGGETVEVHGEASPPLEGEKPAVPVLFEDRSLAVINKPPNLPTHPTANRRKGTLVNKLVGQGMRLAAGGDPLRPGIVHRLDAGTSGLMLIAKDDAGYTGLSKMMRAHEADRHYLALVRGSPEHDRFAVEAALERVKARIVVRPVTGRPAETAFRVEERFERATLLDGAPRTGRTHQIRVHLSAVGLPILGDGRYGGGGDDAKALGLTRPFLHSWRLRFVHPVTGEEMSFEAPLPNDLKKALKTLRAAAP